MLKEKRLIREKVKDEDFTPKDLNALTKFL